MRKIFLAFLLVIFIADKSYGAGMEVNLNNTKIKLNDESKLYYSYNIDGYNYFRIKDIAKSLKNTDKKFDIFFDENKNSITLLRNKNYEDNSQSIYAKKAIAEPTKAKLYIEDKEILISGINISGYNYYRIRDIASIFDFGITYNPSENSVVINTKVEYSSSGNDYLKAPEYGDLVEKEEFIDAFSKSYLNLYRAQMNIISDLMEKGSSNNEILSLQRSLNSYYNYYSCVSKCTYLSNNESIKNMYLEFLNLFGKQIEDYNLVVESTRTLKKENISDNIFIYNDSVKNVTDSFLIIIETLRNQ
ncbi:hypothetical protein ING2D1G_1238 [Peptoniphilus sp. ING2-D1G]|nr:hypothetical protein ING2D1G_1238 [Peptoniphilus sp. ING2-D1G]